MATTRDTQAETGATFTTHTEPTAQGGARFERCTACGAELLTCMGGGEKMLHKQDCLHAEEGF